MDNLDHTYTLPTGITTITKSMLDDVREQKQITHVIIPQGVTSIEKKAFNRCSSLTSIHIPNSVRRIRERAFEICTRLTTITIPDSVTSIEERAFFVCTNLTSITIPDSVTSIKADAFFGCSSLTSITIPNNNTTIELYAFACCSRLTSIIIPDSVTSIGEGAFKYCTSLTCITIPERVTRIEDSVFNGCISLASITIPNSVKIIRDRAFKGCESLDSITIPNSVTSIGEHAFERYYNIRFAIIPTNLGSKNKNYWRIRGINIKATTLITQNKLSTWARSQKLRYTYAYHELAILYQLQKDDNFTLSWLELGKLAPNLLIDELLEVLPEEKAKIVLPKTYKNISIIDNLRNYSLFSVTPAKSRQEHEQKADQLKKDGFKDYKNPDDPTKTIQLKEVSPAATSSILQWLTIKEVATLLNVKASSELRPTLS